MVERSIDIVRSLPRRGLRMSGLCLPFLRRQQLGWLVTPDSVCCRTDVG
ncbi:MAG: hypothetical protein M1546_05785 [Chloroflexi bacterium]|nr:hypothetical protein [Chloroflexota bacterium]